MKNIFELTALVPKTLLCKNRLDLVLKSLFHQYSRTFLKKNILKKNVFVNGSVFDRPDLKVFFKDLICIKLKLKKNNFLKSEDISLDIVYEDNDILIINKQNNLVVHPGAGNKNGTLLNALLYYNDIFLNVPRAGIVHRLDKNTTGLMVVAKNVFAYKALIQQIKDKRVIREYQAIVHGRVISGGTITEPIMRNPIKRTTMKVHYNGKTAITHYRVLQRFMYYTHLRVQLETGRTHQIRVHMLHINFPIIGDTIYNNKRKFCKNISLKLFNKIQKFPRQALHASKLCLYHPVTQCLMEWNSVLPTDMLSLIECLNSNNM